MSQASATFFCCWAKPTAPKQINNSSLYAGSPMTYYCKHCRHVSEVLPECHVERPSHVCAECEPLIKNGWIPA